MKMVASMSMGMGRHTAVEGVRRALIYTLIYTKGNPRPRVPSILSYTRDAASGKEIPHRAQVMQQR
jgi:hypothetical protein